MTTHVRLMAVYIVYLDTKHTPMIIDEMPTSFMNQSLNP